MGRRESTNSSNIMFSVLFFLFIGVQQAACSSSCGDIKDIRPPFWLKANPSDVGDPDFKLTCESNKTILHYRSGKYYVNEIFYDDQTVNVVDVEFANRNCGALPSQPLSITEISDLYIEISDLFHNKKRLRLTVASLSYRREPNKYYRVAQFLNCPWNFSHPSYIKVPCLSGNQSHVYVFFNGSLEAINRHPSCSFISRIPMRLPLQTNPDYENIQKFLQLGFDLLWVEPDCFPHNEIFHQFRFIGSVVELYCSKKSFADYRFFLLVFVFQPLFAVVNLPGIVRPDSVIMWLYSEIDALLGSFLLGSLIVRLILAPVVLLVYIFIKYKKTRKTVDTVEKFLHNQQSWMPKRHSYCEITAMTNGFSYELGQGGFGSVYRGQLHNGCFIAVKVLKKSKFSAEEFINEVSTIGRIHHVNIVQLLGFCSEGPNRALVYEYMPNGSLDKHIFSKGGKGKSFTWKKLHEIAIATTGAIEYLHGGCDVCILHFDIKPHNILLDHNFIPKVSDFGLAKFHPKENDFVSISVTRGTIGYIAPELISRNFGVISCKSDVYSFGMLLLEMVGGRKNSFSMETRSSKAYFPSWVYDQLKKGGDLELEDLAENEIGIARKLCIIGLWCIQVNAANRPSITKVREMLEGSIDDLQMPPKPFFSSSQHGSVKDEILIELDSASSLELLLLESMEGSLYIDGNV
ncbi:LEAF RUST 10 DISEASE-RESISTANCE LOCUS RECEPTOR-LIKE PROTEIN KINASE-like 2.5 [Mangifera indica]|uniref:LEAF RUST 10 DISEASE-RESISTANCE LOCUS RECEPTOR-LIKE PROTEIN KINASE-like 2.5 n=1 Tax=Mangifera indica TaxID=29780 RepID=UPI001CFA27BA|nr:LEAF RUST 10 DISEASE-RESISTANCE LOCUS RECEPTOR-LIKE PROTEIN KINASE-like 2.5 [Mangifera indica]